MKNNYSIEVDRRNLVALAHCLTRMAEEITDVEYDWCLTINAGGIDYGTYINVNIERKEIEICNQPEYGNDGDDSLDELFEAIAEEEDDE